MNIESSNINISKETKTSKTSTAKSSDSSVKFADELKKIYSGEIVFWDERLSTVSASQILNTTNTRGKKRKNVIDTVSACIILEAYLESNRRKSDI